MRKAGLCPGTSPLLRRHRLDSEALEDKPVLEVGHEHFSDLVYADNTAFLLNTTSDAVSSLSSFQDTASALCLRISWPKTKLQNFGAGYHPPSVSVDGNTVDTVDSFVKSSDVYCRPGINRRIGLAASVMSALHNIWKDRYLSISTKIHIYQALVQSVLLYAAETWTLYATDIIAPGGFHVKCQRLLLHISGTRWPSGTRLDFAIARSRVRLPPVAAGYQRVLSVPSLRGRLMSSSLRATG